MNKIILILLLFSVSLVKAQDYYPYYDGINQAKIEIAHDNLDQALSQYYQTFEKFQFVFVRDIYHAIEIAALVKDTVKLQYFIRRGIQRGLPFDQILEMKNVSDFRTSGFIKEIETEKDSLENSYTHSINWEIRNEITEMFRQDQMTREKFYEAILFKRKKIGHEWEALNKKQVERMMEITEQYGFPGEKLIGIDTPQMHYKINKNDLSAGMPIIIFIHHYSQPNESYNAILKNEIQSGNLNNEHYAIISDFQNKYGKGKYGHVPCYSERFNPKESKEIIDKNRKEIGLLSLSNVDQLQRRHYLTPFWMRLR